MMKFEPNFLFLLIITMIFACETHKKENKTSTGPDLAGEKFEPRDGKVILFVGQELQAIGGLKGYDDGYLDHFDTPGGFTMYTNLAPGGSSFGYQRKGLDGVYTTADWGDGPSNMSLQLADPDFRNMALAIGLSMVNHEEKIAKGKHDSLIVALGTFIDNLGDRPVFLRIGYEFDGHAWNHYNRAAYIKAFRRIHNMYDSLGIDNIAYVWQSTGWVSNMEYLEAWYPGDAYVDWCGYSFFSRFEEAKMIDFARLKGKPVFIAEASPTISTGTVKFDGKTKETILSNPGQAKEAWKKWFQPLFRTIDENPDVVKAVSYINANWRSRPMWEENPTFQDVDARLHTSSFITRKWVDETSKDKYLKASEDLFKKLGIMGIKSE